MRSASLQNLVSFPLLLALAAFGCSEDPQTDSFGTPGGSTSVGAGGSSVGNGGSTPVGAGGTPVGTGGTGGSINTGGTNGNPAGGTSNNGPGGPGGAPNNNGAGGTNGNPAGGTGGQPCTNIRPTGTQWDEATCDQWATETDECSAAWMINNNYCNESCGRCSSGPGGGGSGNAPVDNPPECVGTPQSGGMQICYSTQGTLSNGVRYSVWMSNSTQGTNCGTFYNKDATFKASWNMPSDGDLLVRAGLEWNKTQTHEQLGNIVADFAYTKTDVTKTKGYIGVYGWSSGPLIEYYIVEEWMGWNPASNAERIGEYTVDGGTYELYTHTQVNQPSIEGTTTFEQYFGIRKERRQCGRISVSEHFKEWGKLGKHLGKMYEAKLLVETMSGSGTIEFTEAKVYVQ